jgi:hypothetical protein
MYRLTGSFVAFVCSWRSCCRWDVPICQMQSLALTVAQNFTSQTSRDESSIAVKGVYIPGRHIVLFCWGRLRLWMAYVFRQFRTLSVASDTNSVFWLSARMIVKLKRDSCSNTGSREVVMPSEVKVTAVTLYWWGFAYSGIWSCFSGGIGTWTFQKNVVLSKRPYHIILNDDQQDATIFWLICLTLISSICFGRCLRPSAGALNCIYSIWYCPSHPWRPPAAIPVNSIRCL